MHIVSVPRQEIARDMYDQSHIDMHRDEVIVARERTGNETWFEVGRGVAEALDCVGVGSALERREGAPELY